MPTITAIIPNYNHEHFLVRRIESVLNQCFHDFELILLDDASTDNSQQIMERYRGHPKVKAIVFNKVNSGSPFKQWQKGIDLAESEWIWIAESDDYCEDEFLDSLVPALGNDKTSLVYSGVKWVNINGECIKSLDYEVEGWYEGEIFIKQKMLLKNALMNAGQVIFRKTCLKRVELEWSEMKQCGDYALFCDVARQGMVYCNGRYLAYFVRHSKTVSATYLNTLITTQECLHVWKYFYRNKFISKKELKDALIERMQPHINRQSNFSTLKVTDELLAYLDFCQEVKVKISVFKLRIKSMLAKMNTIIKKSKKQNSSIQVNLKQY